MIVNAGLQNWRRESVRRLSRIGVRDLLSCQDLNDNSRIEVANRGHRRSWRAKIGTVGKQCPRGWSQSVGHTLLRCGESGYSSSGALYSSSPLCRRAAMVYV